MVISIEQWFSNCGTCTTCGTWSTWCLKFPYLIKTLAICFFFFFNENSPVHPTCTLYACTSVLHGCNFLCSYCKINKFMRFFCDFLIADGFLVRWELFCFNLSGYLVEEALELNMENRESYSLLFSRSHIVFIEYYALMAQACASQSLDILLNFKK